MNYNFDVNIFFSLSAEVVIAINPVELSVNWPKVYVNKSAAGMHAIPATQI